MENLEQVLKLWETDAQIDQTEPGKEVIKIPMLHNKYLKILVKHRIAVKKATFDYAKMRKIKEEYYNGSMSQEDLEQYGWEPFQIKLSTKAGVEKYIEADESLIRLLEKKVYHEEVVAVCESIMQELKSRTFQLRDFIAWERFIAGQ
jgi:hypothetical protein